MITETISFQKLYRRAFLFSPFRRFSKLFCKNDIIHVPSDCHNYVTYTEINRVLQIAKMFDAQNLRPSVPPDVTANKKKRRRRSHEESFRGMLTWASKSDAREKTRLGRERFRRLRSSYEKKLSPPPITRIVC